ncbi:hypothetical protein [Geodermatophilus sp. DSM 45219]|uniref:hypothetical protein n=1 Tax=Geodermatophilus sp. DSM 45219 TaxID=1881103 RepID=UPI0008841D57|nr:hypothetical protein [Geodermatophilus sp. DSM 45219]SDN78780.1 hypothetical protein SAMN05428965_1625 [Geodermatophilus sp. DSM 45219]
MALFILGTGLVSTSATSVTPAMPSGATAPAVGDQVFIFAVSKPLGVTPTITNNASNWTTVVSQNVGFGTTSAASSGQVRVTVLTKKWETGTTAPTLSVSGTVSTIGAVAQVWRPDTGQEVAWQRTAASDATGSSTAFNATGFDTLVWTTGEHALTVMGLTTNTSFNTGANLVVESGGAQWTMTERVDSQVVGNGNATLAVHTSQQTPTGATTAPTFNAVTTVATTGGGFVFRLFQQPAVVTTPATVTGTTAAVTASAQPGVVFIPQPATVLGTTATGSTTAQAGVITAGATVAGTRALVTGSAIPGTLIVPATVAGSRALASASGQAGTAAGAVLIAGTPASVTVTPQPGTTSVESSAVVVGVTATATVSASPGQASGDASASGSTARATAQTQPGTLVVSATVLGATAGSTATSEAGAPTGEVLIGGESASAAVLAEAGNAQAEVTLLGEPSLVTVSALPGVNPSGYRDITVQWYSARTRELFVSARTRSFTATARTRKLEFP